MSNADDRRQVHLVGTIPADSTESALQLVTDTVGDVTTAWLPDGETGERQNWIGRLVENLKDHPDLELTRDGDWSDYDQTPAFKVKKGHHFDYVSLDYFEHFEESWPRFQKVRTDLDREGLSFQVGIPGPIDVAFAAFGFSPVSGLRNIRPFEDATVLEVSKIHAVGGAEVVYQLEIPIEIEIANRMPKPVRKAGVGQLAGRLLRVVRKSPHDTRWGFHLCVGDMNNTAFSRLDDATTLTLLANAIVDRFPKGRKLEFVHLPLAHGSEPPTLDEEFYGPLDQLRVPNDVRLIAGFAHEGQSLEDQIKLRDMVEAKVGRPVDIAASCGLGRRDLEAAESNLTRSRALVG